MGHANFESLSSNKKSLMDGLESNIINENKIEYLRRKY